MFYLDFSIYIQIYWKVIVVAIYTRNQREKSSSQVILSKPTWLGQHDVVWHNVFMATRNRVSNIINQGNSGPVKWFNTQEN